MIPRRQSRYIRKMNNAKVVIKQQYHTDNTTVVKIFRDEVEAPEKIELEIERDHPNFNHSYAESIILSKEEAKTLVSALKEEIRKVELEESKRHINDLHDAFKTPIKVE